MRQERPRLFNGKMHHIWAQGAVGHERLRIAQDHFLKPKSELQESHHEVLKQISNVSVSVKSCKLLPNQFVYDDELRDVQI